MTGPTDTKTAFGFTFGVSHTQSSWGDARQVSWPGMVEMLTSHVPGQKEGACIVPAIFSGGRRNKEEATQIDVAFLDSDSGATLDEITAALKGMGWEAVVSSTHSHMSTRTSVSRTNWDRYFAKHPDADAGQFLRDEKGYLETVATGAVVHETDETHVHLVHGPCPKFRIAIPLQRPWRAVDYPSQATANGAWKERIEALASALSLSHDQACTDTSRLFYLPRRPPMGAVPETAVVTGDYCDIFALPGAPDLLSVPRAEKVNGHKSLELSEYADPITGQYVDLVSWAKASGRTFLVAKAIKARKPGTITGLIVDNCKVHIDCPNSNTHTSSERDAATFVVNAGNAETEGFVIHCRHAHCTGKDRLFFVRRMLEERWLEIDDLTEVAFHIDAPEDPHWESVETAAEHAAAPDRGEIHKADPFLATSIGESELETIPPREIVYGHFLFKKFISAIGAPGGAGKTAYSFGVALAVATGRDLLGEPVHEPGNVWIYNLEDPRVELLRRVKAALIGHDLTWRDIEGRLFLDSGRDRPLIIAKATRDGGLIAWPQVPDLIAEIKAKQIKLLIVDPFVRSHRVEENYNDQIDFVAALWASIADAADCSILLVHHFKKGGVSGDAGAFRGATALIDASRAAVTLATMSSEEAEHTDIAEKDRWQYVRVDNAKLNLAPPPDGAVWLRLTGIDLNNAANGRASDSVQTVKRWRTKKRTSPFKRFSTEDCNAALDIIQEGPERGVLFTATKRGGSGRWVGRVLVEHLHLEDDQAAEVISTWIHNGLLIEANYMHPKWRRVVPGVQVDNTKRPQ